MSVNWRAIGEKWQRLWREHRVFESNPQPNKPKFFLTVAYPYPNSPQHIGHGRTYTLADVYARFKRMQGYNVLFPMAFHYTGTPIMAMSKRIAEGDEELINDFVQVYKVPREFIEKFKDPLEIAKYFHGEIKRGMEEMGYSIDWRREFTTVDPQYNRFIEWQFRRLFSRGFLKRGSHPVGWCPSCANPVGQHDTRGDVEPEIGEFTLIKFKMDDKVLPAATLRPETVFGVTNIWLNPEADYVEAEISGEIWVISAKCAEKLPLLNKKVRVLNRIKGRELIGKYAVNPANGRKVAILPASFVDVNNATGVVMSVPAHAPYDYIALKELKSSTEILSEYGIENIVKLLEPISIISTDGLSDKPAVDVIERHGISSQLDKRIEQLTKEVYSKELYSGVMKENTGIYAGLSVREAREKIKFDLIAENKADTMQEILNRPVYCRCGSECVVKIFEDQWFIDYANSEWKKLAKECLSQMKIVPSEIRTEFFKTIDWLRERACARKRGLGTKLPWDKEWVIESLSDSVIYMSYYTIARIINEHKIPAEKLTDEVFDYVFLGEGNSDDICAKTGLDRSTIEQMRSEFLYYYPLDSRNSGRDLVPNHLTFFILNHVAIFPRELWPKQVVVNGSVLMEGKKMSKTFGNIIPLREAIRKYGADPLRVSILATAELLQDADFSDSFARIIARKLEEFFNSALKIIESKKSLDKNALEPIDKWLLSKLQERIKTVTNCLEELKVREAINQVLYLIDQDIQWYLKRTSAEKDKRKEIINGVLFEVLKTRIKLLAPFAPHLCEELWSMMGEKPFVSTSSWPVYDESLVDEKALEIELFLQELLEDTKSILKVLPVKPRKIVYYVSSAWKYELYAKLLEAMRSGATELRQILSELMKIESIRKKGKEAANLIRKIYEDVIQTYPEIRDRRLRTGKLDEQGIIKNAKDFLEREFDADILVFSEEDENKYDPKGKAKLARPYKPAIYIE